MAVLDLANLGEIRRYAQFLLESESEGTTTLWPQEVLDAFIAAEHRVMVNRINLANKYFFHRASTADITTDEFYELPPDFRHLHYLEFRTAQGRNIWSPIRPLDTVRRRDEYFLEEGVSIGETSFSGFGGAEARYYISGNFLVLVPFFNTVMPAGLRMWYDFSPLGPTAEQAAQDPPAADDLWVPFGGQLRDHHEILAYGAAIRGKEREQDDHSYGTRFTILWNGVIDAVDARQKQESQHGADLEGYHQ